MNKEELIERYIGAYPDERFQKGRKTWEELRNSMHADLDLFVSNLSLSGKEERNSLQAEIESLKGKLKEIRKILYRHDIVQGNPLFNEIEKITNA